MKGLGNGIALQHFNFNLQHIADAGGTCEPVLSTKWFVTMHCVRSSYFDLTCFQYDLVSRPHGAGFKKYFHAEYLNGSIFVNLGCVKEQIVIFLA